MLKFEKVATVGDYIRAYDFKPMRGRLDCYVEGEVLAVTSERGYTAFKIKVLNDVYNGTVDETEGSRNGRIVFVPLETSFMEYDSRIMNLSN